MRKYTNHVSKITEYKYKRIELYQKNVLQKHKLSFLEFSQFTPLSRK